MTDKANIFYTDDDLDDQMLFKEVVEDLTGGVTLFTQKNGEELINQLGNRPPTPKIIFLDLNMPVKNGFQALREIRQSEDLRSFPVVIFTTSNDTKSIDETRRLGADLFITKPQNYSAYCNAISYVLSIDWKHFRSGHENFVYQSN
jgi:CheY-like chemotaxis protein